MSSKSDEIISLNYSYTSMENAKKGDKDKKTNKEKSNKSVGKKNLIKSPSFSASKNKNYKNGIILPELKNNNSRDEISKKKMHLTSSSFNKNKINTSIDKNSNKTFNSPLNNNSSFHKYFNNEKDIKDDYKKEETPTKIIESLKNEIQNKNKIIESLISNNNNNSYIQSNKNSLINILSTKKKKQENEKNNDGEGGNNDSKIIEKKFNNIKSEFEAQKKKINSLKKEEKISKDKELEMENRILLEQCNKLNHLYFDVLKKLIEYEDFINNINKLKESLIKKEYILIELQDKYSKAILDLNRNNQEIENLRNMLSKKNSQLKQNKKQLDYYFQLNQKLLIEADNIDTNPKIINLKSDYENKIAEYKKSLTFYKEENYRKDRIILDLNNGSINDLNNVNENNKRYLFKNAQKINKEYFINKENIDLKNKINLLQEKISKLNKTIKEYEQKEKYLFKNRNNQINLKNSLGKENKKSNVNNQIILGNNFSRIDYLEKSKESIEDEDCDFMSNYNMNEFLYILKKCFEAQNINIGDIESKVLNGETFNLLVNKENYNSFILNVSANFCNLLKIMKTRDQFDTLSFVKTFLYNNFISNENKIDEFQKIFLNCFPDIIIYDKELEETYLKKISGYFKDKFDLLKNEFESFDLNKKGIITFISLKKIIVEKLKINIKKEILEYMIYFMKKYCINNNNSFNEGNIYSLRDLNYTKLLEEIYNHISNNNIDTNNMSYSEYKDNNEINNNDGFLDSNENEDNNSYIEITDEEYNKKNKLIIDSIKEEIIKKSNDNAVDYLNKLFNKFVFSDNDGHQIIELNKLIDEIKNSLYIELNQIEIFCLYSKFKINEDKIPNNTTELIDYESFKNEILLNINKNIKENKQIEINKDINENNSKNNDLDIKQINKEEDKNDKNKTNKNNEDIKKEESQIDEYNDFENNNFANEDETINF